MSDQFPSLTALNAELPPPPPQPWWIRWDLIPIALCLCIAAVTAFAIGALK